MAILKTLFDVPLLQKQGCCTTFHPEMKRSLQKQMKLWILGVVCVILSNANLVGEHFDHSTLTGTALELLGLLLMNEA
jgi:hypothetical protein